MSPTFYGRLAEGAGLCGIRSGRLTRRRAHSVLGCKRQNPYNGPGVLLAVRAVAGEKGEPLAGKIKGKVVSASPGGDLVTDLTAEQLRQIPAGATVVIACDGHQTQGILPLDHSEPEMTFVAVVGPTEQLELRLVGDSASTFLGIRPGSDVVVKW